MVYKLDKNINQRFKTSPFTSVNLKPLSTTHLTTEKYYHLYLSAFEQTQLLDRGNVFDSSNDSHNRNMLYSSEIDRPRFLRSTLDICGAPHARPPTNSDLTVNYLFIQPRCPPLGSSMRLLQIFIAVVYIRVLYVKDQRIVKDCLMALTATKKATQCRKVSDKQVRKKQFSDFSLKVSKIPSTVRQTRIYYVYFKTKSCSRCPSDTLTYKTNVS